ncbi:MAG: hypothetical protein SFT68_03605 [Rickettsiaceae bacterium]|nr:hypothetical protein [Rickettsiaceae bacterium]
MNKISSFKKDIFFIFFVSFGIFLNCLLESLGIEYFYLPDFFASFSFACIFIVPPCVYTALSIFGFNYAFRNSSHSSFDYINENTDQDYKIMYESLGVDFWIYSIAYYFLCNLGSSKEIRPKRNDIFIFSIIIILSYLLKLSLMIIFNLQPDVSAIVIKMLITILFFPFSWLFVYIMRKRVIE